MKTVRRLKRKVRHIRVRKHVLGLPEKPRLVIFRSNKAIYAQVIDDLAGKTLVSASSLEVGASKPKGKAKETKGVKSATALKKAVKEAKAGKPEGGKVAVSKQVGELLAEKCKKAKITEVVFDRAGYKFHGRVATLAEGARSKGLKL